MASRQALRKAWWQVHKWGGLLLMILLIPLGLSGAVLAWDDAIDHEINPQRYAVHGTAAVLPAAAYAQAAARATRPGDRVAVLRYPDGEGPLIVNVTHLKQGKAGKPASPQRISVWLDPTDARVLDVSANDSGLLRIAHSFHGNLFIPAFGRAIIGLLGIVMFLMALGGIWLWFPPIGRWSAGLRWQRGDRKLDTNLHHRIGFWIALPLALQAVTGVWIAWPQMLVAVGLVEPRPGQGIDRSKMVPTPHVALTPDAAIAAARALKPGTPTTVTWPTGRDGAWRISLDTAKGSADFTVDDATGVAKPTKKREGDIASLMRHIHDGSAIGWGWRVLMLAWGLAPTVLGVTGLLMWWRGRRWRADAARRKRKNRASVAVS